MDNIFLDLYKQFQKMDMNGKDLDHMLNALPWEEVKNEDGTVSYVCKIKEEK